MSETSSPTIKAHTHAEDSAVSAGPRKLIRPKLPAQALADFRHPHSSDPLTAHAGRPVGELVSDIGLSVCQTRSRIHCDDKFSR